MYRTDAADNVGSFTPKASIGTVGYYKDSPGAGTVVDADHMNAIQEELCTLVENAGLTLNYASVQQLSAAVGGGAVAKSHATDTGAAAESNHLAAVVASSNSRAQVAYSLVLASIACVASGSESVAMASLDSNVTGNRCAVIGCSDVDVTGNHSVALASWPAANTLTLSGDYSALIGCSIPDGTHATLAGTSCVAIASTGAAGKLLTFTAGAERCVTIACSEGGLFDANSRDCAIIASRVAEFSSANAKHSAIIACGWDSAGAETDHVDIETEYSAAIGCTGEAHIATDNCVVIASKFGTSGVTIYDRGLLMYDGTTKQIHLDPSNGMVTCQKLRCDDDHALGGGATATLGTIGLTGPTNSAAQAQWLKVNIDNVDHWIAVWR